MAWRFGLGLPALSSARLQFDLQMGLCWLNLHDYFRGRAVNPEETTLVDTMDHRVRRMGECLSGGVTKAGGAFSRLWGEVRIRVLRFVMGTAAIG